MKTEGLVVEGRKPLVEVDWYKASKTMAMADVMMVARVGLCSHQGQIGPGRFKMTDEAGNVHRIGEDRLFMPTFDEVRKYWLNYHTNRDDSDTAENFKKVKDRKAVK